MDKFKKKEVKKIIFWESQVQMAEVVSAFAEKRKHPPLKSGAINYYRREQKDRKTREVIVGIKRRNEDERSEGKYGYAHAATEQEDKADSLHEIMADKGEQKEKFSVSFTPFDFHNYVEGTKV